MRLILGTLLTLFSTVALADEPGAPRLQTSDPHQWSAGVGLSVLGTPSLGVAGLGGLGTLGGLGALNLGPALGAGVERRLTERLWLRAQLTGSYRVSEVEGLAPQKFRYINGSVGVRGVLWAPKDITLSAFGSLGLGRGANRIALNGADPVEQKWTTGFGQAGLFVDYALTQNLSLRFGSGILYAAYSRDRVQSTTPTIQKTWDLGLRLDPSLELRLFF